MLATLRDERTRGAVSEVLSPKELQRATRIAQELARVETASSRLPDVGGVINDTPSTVISFLVRTFAARQGARAGQGVSGASLLTASFASRRVKELLANLTNDRAHRLLSDAIQDPELFRSLLLNGRHKNNATRIERNLSAWIAGQTGASLGGRESGQEAQPAGAPPPPPGFQIINGAAGGFKTLAQASAAEPMPDKAADVLRRSARFERPVPAFDLAKAFSGLSEGSHTGVLSAFSRQMTGTKIDPSETPWCAAFANAVLRAAGSEGTGRLNARSFLDFGTPTDRPSKGDVVVLWRESPDSWKGHVGFFAGTQMKHGKRQVRVLGGNQDDAVSIKLYPADRVLGFRRPPKRERSA